MILNVPFIKRIKYNGKSILSRLLTFLWETLFMGQELYAMCHFLAS